MPQGGSSSQTLDEGFPVLKIAHWIAVCVQQAASRREDCSAAIGDESASFRDEARIDERDAEELSRGSREAISGADSALLGVGPSIEVPVYPASAQTWAPEA